MDSFNYVFIVSDPEKNTIGIFLKKSNAVDKVPEPHRNYALQQSESLWLYGDGVKKWSIKYMKVQDSNGL